MANYSTHKYDFEIKLFGEEFTDVAAMSVIRTAFMHTSSYTILNLSVRTMVYLALQTAIEKSEFPEMEITCHLLDTSKPSASSAGIKVGLRKEILFTKTYKAIKCTTHELLGKTTLDILKDYESHLTSLFGDIFDFKKIGDGTEVNDFSYEQILIRLENDLCIPNWLQQTYKIFNTPAIYFFDEFRIDDSSTKDITAYLINFGNKDDFKKINIMDEKYHDIFMANKFVKNFQIGDVFNETFTENPTVNVKCQSGQFWYKKSEGQTQAPKGQQTTMSFSIDQRTYSAVQAIKPLMSGVQPTEHKTVYAPEDTYDNAIKRYSNANMLLKKDITHATVWTLKDSNLDFIQFGNSYLLNVMEKSQFRHTPIGIVNQFVRESGMYPYLIHNCIYQTLAFKADQDWM